MKRLIVALFVAMALALIPSQSITREVDWDTPPAPRPKDPRLKLQPVFDANGVVYEWKSYVSNPVNGQQTEIEVSESPRLYNIQDANNEYTWTVELATYSQMDRLEPQPQGVRVTLLDIKHPPGTERPHFEFDISGHVTVAMTLEDVPQPLPPKSVFDPKSIAKNIGVGYSSLIVSKPLPNTVFVENNAFTHPDRAGGPDVASHSERTLNAGRETVNEIRIYQDPESNGFAYAWQGGNARAALSVGESRVDHTQSYGVVFTIPWGFVRPSMDGIIDRSASHQGVTGFLRYRRGNDDTIKRDPVETPPPVSN